MNTSYNKVAINASTCAASFLKTVLGRPGLEPRYTINDDSVIVAADVLATNGVIHAIDTVLMPSSDEPTKGPTAMEESDSAGRAGLAVAAAAAVAYVL